MKKVKNKDAFFSGFIKKSSEKLDFVGDLEKSRAFFENNSTLYTMLNRIENDNSLTSSEKNALKRKVSQDFATRSYAYNSNPSSMQSALGGIGGGALALYAVKDLDIPDYMKAILVGGSTLVANAIAKQMSTGYQLPTNQTSSGSLSKWMTSL